MINKTAQHSYDEVPYPSFAYPPTHPDHLATLATLSGMSPPPVAHCRVLELGCASGGNLIPMAYTLPESKFEGMDFSAREVADGQAILQALGLKNVTLNHLNILDVTSDFGQFDYIIVYGIYTWVNPAVQDRILEICRQNLVPNGVAYVSYNVYPGWHMNTIIRDVLLYHTRRTTKPQARIEQARALLKFMAESVPTENNLYGHFLRSMQEFLQPKPDAYLFHDFMEDVNEPLYFSQFIERAKRHGLQYLANAEFATPSKLPAEVAQAVLEMTEDIIEIEQYMDFLTNRGFRETLLCHQDVSLSRTLNPDYLATLRVASRAEPATPDMDVRSTEVEEFRGSDDTSLATAHPLTKTALRYLAQVWPQAVPFYTLLAAARSMLDPAAEAEPDAVTLAHDVHVLGTNLLQAYSQSISLIEFHTHVPHFVLEVSERPMASAAARYQAQNGLPVTNLYHQGVTMGEVPRHLLVYLDGSRDRTALLDVLVELAAQGILEVKQDDQPVEDVELVRRILEGELDTQLRQMAQAALLVG